MPIEREIVGVVRDVRQGPADLDTYDVYVPLLQAPTRFAFLLVRTAAEPTGWLTPLRAAMREIDPEIAVDLTALTRGAPAIALGDALGSSLIDATLSIGAGPLVAPAEVTPRLAVVGSLYALVAVAAVGTILVLRRRHDRMSAAACFLLYALAYAVLVGAE